MTLTTLWILGTLLLLLALLMAVTSRKARRDLAELSSGRHRHRLSAALTTTAAPAAIDAALRAGRVAQQDLLAVLRSPGHTVAPGSRYPLLEDQLGARDPAARGRAVILLSLLGTPEAARLLGPRLADQDLDVRLATANALERVGGPTATLALLGALEDGRLTRPRVVERLAHGWAVAPMLAHAPAASAVVRAAIWQACGLAGDATAAPALEGALRVGEPEERIAAARSLGQLDAPTSPEGLRDALRDERWEVRAQAATALGRLRCRDAVPALRAALGDPAFWVRSNAATALAGLGGPGRAALEDACEGDDRYAAERAAEALQFLELPP